MELGETFDMIVQGALLRSRGGTFLFWNSAGVLWAKRKDAVESGEAPFFGWRTHRPLDLKNLVEMAPFTVVGFPKTDDPEELARCERECLQRDARGR